jgi:F420-dependent methylenetetrahydromethanopterin dehydrogenase
VVVHTSGPYDPETGYHVAKAVVDSGSSACIVNSQFFLTFGDIDIADSRDFVVKFASQIKDVKNCVLITGASSVPGVSSAAVNEFGKSFSQMDSVEVCITPGNQTPRGPGTSKSVLLYCGKPFSVTINKKLETVYGWMGIKRERIIGLRFVLDTLCVNIKKISFGFFL